MPARAVHERTVERLRFRQAPLGAAAVWFALGICANHWLAARDAAVPVVVLAGGIGLLGLIAAGALGSRARTAWVAVAGVWIALGVAAAEWKPGPVSPVALLGFADNLSRTVEGRVTRVRVAPPVVAAQANDADTVAPWEAGEISVENGRAGPVLTLDVAVDAVEEVTPETSAMVPATGGVRVQVYGEGAPAIECGDRVRMPLRMKTPERYRDPGAFQYADLLAGQGIAARASVGADGLEVLGAGAPTMACKLAAAQGWASGRLLGFADSAANGRMPMWLQLSRADASMLDAMLFGDRAGLSHTLRVGFERTGSFHLFVVSGLHIALLAGAVYWGLRRLRMPEWATTVLTIAAATAYAAVTGFGQPAQRSLGMTSVFLLARLLSREHDRMPLNALGAAALAMLVWSPGSLFEASFQMTVLAIVAIAGIAVPLGKRTVLRYAPATKEVFQRRSSSLKPRAAQLRMMLELWGEAVSGLVGGWSRKTPAAVMRLVLWGFELALVACVAEMVMVLPMALYFHRAAVFALPANMVVIPVIALLAPLGVATFCCALLSPWLAVVPGGVTALLLHFLRLAIGHASRVAAADVRVPGPVWWVATLAVLVWGGCCWLVRRGRLGAWATALALPVIAAMVLWPEQPFLRPGALEVTAIDVGQGDSLLAVNPEGGTMLIDAGGPVGSHGASEIVARFDVGEEVVSPYLWSRRMRRLDVLVLSHAHTDHMGGMTAVMENFRPKELWVGVDTASPLYAALLAEAARLGVVVRHFRAGDQAHWGSVEVTVLSPAVEYANTGPPKNDDSLVLRMQWGKASALLEGDAEEPSEEAMVAAGLVTPVTLLKVGHHGSKTSSNPSFLAAASPRDAVVSVGKGNTFGHPRGEVIGRLAAGGTHLFRTDKFGLTTFLLTPDGGIRERAGGAAATDPEP